MDHEISNRALSVAEDYGVKMKERESQLERLEVCKIEREKQPRRWVALEANLQSMKNHNFLSRHETPYQRFTLVAVEPKEQAAKKLEEEIRKDVEEDNRKIKLYKWTLGVLQKDSEVMEAALAFAMLVKSRLETLSGRRAKESGGKRDEDSPLTVRSNAVL